MAQVQSQNKTKSMMGGCSFNNPLYLMLSWSKKGKNPNTFPKSSFRGLSAISVLIAHLKTFTNIPSKYIDFHCKMKQCLLEITALFTKLPDGEWGLEGILYGSFLWYFRNYTRQTSGMAMNHEASGFVNSAVTVLFTKLPASWFLAVPWFCLVQFLKLP